MPLYLAMTAAEISGCRELPPRLAYMACHFSPYSTGLSNLPADLPKGSVIILNDRIPVCGHDPDTVAGQLTDLCDRLEADSILLDLQRPFDSHLQAIVQAILEKSQCPVAVSEVYAKDLNCAVFLSAPPLHSPIDQYAVQWSGRELWLEAVLEELTYAITETASYPVYAITDAPLPCPELSCHYGFREEKDKMILSMKRTVEDLELLIQNSAITKAIGLYQQLGKEKELLSGESSSSC